MGFRLIASDIDDTLINSSHTLSERTIKTVRQLVDKGYIFTLATGRMYSSAKIIADQMDLDVPLITYNGSLVKMSKSHEILYERSIHNDYAREIVKEGCKLKNTNLYLYLDDQIHMDMINKRSQVYSDILSVPINSVGDMMGFLGDRNPTTIVLLGDENEIADFGVNMRSVYDEQLCITNCKPHFLEFNNIEGDKGKGLEAVMNHFGIHRDETLVFGDSPNDYHLFRACGYGVAVANADPKIKEIADEVGLSNDDDGVADGIMRLVLDPKK